MCMLTKRGLIWDLKNAWNTRLNDMYSDAQKDKTYFRKDKEGNLIGYKVVDTDNVNPFTNHATYKYREGLNVDEDVYIPKEDWETRVHEGFHVVATKKDAKHYMRSLWEDPIYCICGRKFKVIKVLIPPDAKYVLGWSTHPRGTDAASKVIRSIVTDRLIIKSLKGL